MDIKEDKKKRIVEKENNNKKNNKKCKEMIKELRKEIEEEKYILYKKERLVHALELFIAALLFYALIFYMAWEYNYLRFMDKLWLNLFSFFGVIFLTVMFYKFGNSLNFWLKLKLYSLYFIIIMLLFGIQMAFAFWIAYFLTNEDFFEKLGIKIRKLFKSIK